MTFLNDDFWKVVSNRKSVRRYLDKPVPDELIEKIISAAARAPSAHNQQPWHYIICTSNNVREKLAEKMAEKYNSDMKVRGTLSHVRETRINRSRFLLKQAPVLIFAFSTENGGEEYPAAEKIMRIQSVAVSSGYLLLAATALGLGACWYSAPLFCRDVLHQHLHVPDRWEPQALITLGYPDEAPQIKQKKTVREIITYV